MFTDTICKACDDLSDATSCAAGMTCFTYAPKASACARYCCTDADCGSGHCSTKNNNVAFFGTVAPNLGLCTP
jgi:hypothetical protein